MMSKMDLAPTSEEARKSWSHSESPRRPSNAHFGVPPPHDIGSAEGATPPPIHLLEKEGDRNKGVMKSSKGRPTKRTSPQKMVPPGYMAETINSATKKSPRVARSSSVTHIPPERRAKPRPQMSKPENFHAVSASELRARLESLQSQKMSPTTQREGRASTRLKVADLLDVGSSSESSPHSSKLGLRQWNFGDGISQFSSIARFYGDQVPFLPGRITFTAPISPMGGSAMVTTCLDPSSDSPSPVPPPRPPHLLTPQSPTQGPSASLPPPLPPNSQNAAPPPAPLSTAAVIAKEADVHPIDKAPGHVGHDGYVSELEDKIKSLQNAINVLHLERSSAQEKANILEGHCKRITAKWETDRAHMLELESKLSSSKSDGSEDPGACRKPFALENNAQMKGTEPSWDTMRLAELEHMRMENNRLRDENALLKRRIVSLNADIETQSHLVKQRTKSVVPELKVLRRRISDLEAENEELAAIMKRTKPFEDLDVSALVKEHAELRPATNELLMQHDKVCGDYLALRDAIGSSAIMSENIDYSPEATKGMEFAGEDYEDGA